MIDPFLHTHRLGPRFFSIGGKVSPVAIRDQMVRAELFIQRAHERGWLKDNQNRPILIVGAGAAGASAALLSADRFKIPTHLIDRGDQPFRVQSNCSSRWLDPTLYDFPVDHWNCGQYPPHSPAVAPYFAWVAGWADQLALKWSSELFRVAQTPGSRLEFKPDTTLIRAPKLDTSGDFVEVTINERGELRENQEYALVLLALGPGRERTYLEDDEHNPLPTRGYPFWMEDRIGMQNYGLHSRPSILISGSGDGALQDFLRVTTHCKSPKEIYEVAPLEKSQLCELHSVQRRAERVLAWGHGTHTDHAALKLVHDAVQRSVDRCLMLGGEELRKKLLELLRQPLPEVQLWFSCVHFSGCYLINHYLSLLVARVIEDEWRVPVLIPNRRLKKIEGADGHVCVGDANDCYGKLHTAWPVVLNDCRGSEGAILEPQKFNVVIIRHGTVLDELTETSTPVFQRHFLPFYIPE